MKTVLITGGGSGIGQATAYELARQQYRVVIMDRFIERANETTSFIQAEGGTAHAIAGDISDELSVKEAIRETVSIAGGLNVLINNAGINMMDTVENCTVEQFDRCMSVNLRGHFLCVKYALPHLKEASHANIVNVSSTRAFTAASGGFPYNLCKAAMLAFTQSLAVELGEHRIRVNAVCPGLIKTAIEGPEFWDPNTPYMKKALSMQPLGEIGKPEDIAQTIAFLISEQASFINGEFLVIDGGRNALKYYFGC